MIRDADGKLRVTNLAIGKPYARADEAEKQAEARRQAEIRVQELETELARLKEELRGQRLD